MNDAPDPNDDIPDGTDPVDDTAPPEDRAGADATDPTVPDDPTVPERLCRRCSTVTATTGEFCPHCGASYVRRRRLPQLQRRTKRILVALVVVLLLAGGGTGALLKVRADDRAEKREQAEQRAEDAARAARERRERAEAKAAAAEQDAADAEERLNKEIRRMTVRELRKSITKDARAKQADGLLDDRARSTDCESTDGHEDDLSESSGEYSCIAITDVDAGGGSSGYRFTARVDFEEGSYTWHLGD
ncbi:hypothetical protein [Patulibacter minatonensis]|uniref:hypothetical protein n=1 Tax=Patulibacter minatonensis TaxID=298163 RepID=UPI0012FB8EEF|nr:hypothetical protein [Patulibacter minatonensis]